MLEEPLRDLEMELILGAGHRYIEQPPLFLDQLGPAGGVLVGEIAIGHIQYIHRVPFLALGRVNGGQDEIVLVEVRRSGEIARPVAISG